jgi:hypothetical protein
MIALNLMSTLGYYVSWSANNLIDIIHYEVRQRNELKSNLLGNKFITYNYYYGNSSRDSTNTADKVAENHNS